MTWNPVDLSGRPMCFYGMRATPCRATATRYTADPDAVFMFYCDAHAEGPGETLPIAIAGPPR